MRDHRGDQIQARVETARDAPARDHSQPAEPQRRAARIRFPPLDRLLPRVAALARNGFAPPVRPLRQYERILVHLLAEIEAGVIDDIILLHDVRLLEVAAAGGFLADDLHLGVVVRVGGGGHALQQAGVRQGEGARADGHEGALFAGVLLLQGGEGFDERDGLAVRLQHGVHPAAAGDDEHVVVVQIFVRVVEIDVRLDRQPGGCSHTLRCGGDGTLERFRGYFSPNRVSR